MQPWDMRLSILHHACDKGTAGEALGNYLRVDCKFSPLQVAEVDIVLDMNSRKSRTRLGDLNLGGRFKRGKINFGL